MRAFLAALLLLAPAVAEESLEAQDRSLRKFLAEEHHKLAAACVRDGLVEEARAEFSAVLRAVPGDAAAQTMLAGPGRTWVLNWDAARHEKFLEYKDLRRLLAYEASDRLLKLGREARAAGDTELATACWSRALEYDPDYEEARTELGEVKVEGVGWTSKADAEKYAKGQVPFNGKWMGKEAALKRRKTWTDAWVLRSDHFQVRTNHSEEAGRRVLGWAEEMYHVVIRETSGVFSPPDLDEPMQILLFATREDYDRHNNARHTGGIPRGIIGYFSTEDNASHFWYREDTEGTPLDEIVKHECTHQLLNAIIPLDGDPSLRPHFWVHEGLARYFESVENRDGKLLAGNPAHLPFKIARARLDKAIPLARLVQLPQPEMGEHYEQAAGITHFFMNAGDAEYRERFLEYCRIAHRGQAETKTFEECLGSPAADFDPPWRLYMKSLK